MKKYFLLLAILLSTNLLAKIVNNKPFPAFQFEDQFEKKYTLTNNIKKVILAFTKKNGHIVKEYMEDKPADFLSSKHILFIADISKMPSIIAYLFAKPDMRDSKYPVLLIEDENITPIFLKKGKKDFFTIVEIDNKTVKSIKYVKSKNELKMEIEND